MGMEDYGSGTPIPTVVYLKQPPLFVSQVTSSDVGARLLLPYSQSGSRHLWFRVPSQSNLSIFIVQHRTPFSFPCVLSTETYYFEMLTGPSIRKKESPPLLLPGVGYWTLTFKTGD